MNKQAKSLMMEYPEGGLVSKSDLLGRPFSLLLRSLSEQARQEKKLKPKSTGKREEKVQLYDVISERSVMYPYSVLLEDISSAIPHEINRQKKHRKLKPCDRLFDNSAIDKSLVEGDPNFVYSKKLLEVVEKSKKCPENDKLADRFTDQYIMEILQNLHCDAKLDSSNFCCYSLLLLKACKEYRNYNKVNNNSIEYDRPRIKKMNYDPAFFTEDITVSSTSVDCSQKNIPKGSKAEIAIKKYKKSVPDLIPCSTVSLSSSSEEEFLKDDRGRHGLSDRESCGKCSLIFPNHFDLECHRKMHHSNIIEEKNRE